MQFMFHEYLKSACHQSSSCFLVLQWVISDYNYMQHIEKVSWSNFNESSMHVLFSGVYVKTDGCKACFSVPHSLKILGTSELIWFTRP